MDNRRQDRDDNGGQHPLQHVDGLPGSSILAVLFIRVLLRGFVFAARGSAQIADQLEVLLAEGFAQQRNLLVAIGDAGNFGFPPGFPPGGPPQGPPPPAHQGPFNNALHPPPGPPPPPSPPPPPGPPPPAYGLQVGVPQQPPPVPWGNEPGDQVGTRSLLGEMSEFSMIGKFIHSTCNSG